MRGRVLEHGMRGFGIILGTTGWSALALGQTPSLTFIPPLDGGIDTFVSGISADGRFVSGESYAAGIGYVGFTWTREGGRVDWGLAPGVPLSTRTIGVTNDGGTAVGYRSFFTTGGVSNTESFRYANGTYSPIGPTPPSTNVVRASGVSGDGSVIVGGLGSSRFDRISGAFRWTASGGLQDLGTARPNDVGAAFTGVSRDGRTAIGHSSRTFDIRDACTWTERDGWRVLPVPDGTSVQHDAKAYGVSTDGSFAVGDVRPLDGPAALRYSALVWRSGVPSYLGAFGADWDMTAAGISDDGRVIAGNGIQIGTQQNIATIWINGGGPIAFQDYLASVGVFAPAGWTLSGIGDMTPDGHTILGLAERNGRYQAFIATIPSPGGVAAGGAPIVWLAARRRRCRPASPTT